MEIQLKIMEYLHKQEEEGKHRMRSGKFNPSGLGGCFRKQYLSRRNEPVSNPPDEQGLRNFEMGKIMHAYVQSLYLKCTTEVGIWTEHFTGFADLVDDVEVTDFKYVKSYAWKFLVQKKGENYVDYLKRIARDKIHNVYQVIFYANKLGKERGRICYINEKLETLEFIYVAEDWKLEVEKECEHIVRYWERGELPPAAPRLFNGKECEYCNWKNLCQGGKL